MRGRFGSVREALVSFLLLGLQSLVLAQASPRNEWADQYLMTGTIEVHGGRYALVDDDGAVKAYLIHRSSLDLNRHVGQTVEATVREPLLRVSDEPRVWVDHVASKGNHARGRASPAGGDSLSRAATGLFGHVALTQFSEPLVMEEVPGEPMMACQSSTKQMCGPPGRVWVSGEYLTWWPDGMHIPALVTSSPAGTPSDQAGVLGQPGTRILYGDREILDGLSPGLRAQAGIWFDRQHRYGIQGEYVWLQRETDEFTAGCDESGLPIVARPYFNINPRDPTNALDPPAREYAQLICYPSLHRGAVTVESSTQFQSAGLALRALIASETFSNEYGTGYSRVDLVSGYRYTLLEDRLGIHEDRTTYRRDQTLATFQVADQFDTRNRFHGIDVGAVWYSGWRNWTAEFLLKTAVGNVNQKVGIEGRTMVIEPGVAPESHEGGLLALSSNIGTYSQDQFTMIPELGAKLGFQVLPRWQATVGYTFIYWGSVARAGDQIDRDINPDQVPPPIVPMEGAARPVFAFQETDYWIHGLSVGLEGRW
ncbi:MAG: BBP7 family outer membrane beta-barrel protein [Planctomycetota bacterium]